MSSERSSFTGKIGFVLAAAGSAVPSAQYIPTSSLPVLITLLLFVTESVNHANVVPTSIVKHTSIETRLIASERLVFVFFIKLPRKNAVR